MDYQGSNVTIEFSAFTDATQCFNVTILGDSEIEPEETFVLTFVPSNPRIVKGEIDNTTVSILGKAKSMKSTHSNKRHEYPYNPIIVRTFMYFLQ